MSDAQSLGQNPRPLARSPWRPPSACHPASFPGLEDWRTGGLQARTWLFKPSSFSRQGRRGPVRGSKHWNPQEVTLGREGVEGHTAAEI